MKKPEDYLPPDEKPAKRRPPAPRKGKRKKKPMRHFTVEADIGDGTVRRCVLSVGRGRVVIHVYRSRKMTWALSIQDAAEILARRAQVREAEMRMGTRRTP